MKLLIYDWTFITKHDLYQSLKRQGVEIELFQCRYSPRLASQREKFQELLSEAVKEKEYDAFFSINFFEDFALEANKKGILYICWTYDSPSLGGMKPELSLDTNRIFVFDSSEYEEYEVYGLKHLYYLPLAVDAERLSRIAVPPMTKLKCYTDISFVGQLYQANMDKIFPLFDEYSAGYIAALINTQLGVYGSSIIKDLVNINIIDKLCNEEVKKVLIDNMNNEFLYDVEQVANSNLTAFLLKAVTNKERVLLLTLLAKYFRVNLYTKGEPELPGVRNMGLVDYVREMPLVFKCSRINLNITLRTIKCGIPQRVLDIMGCGALVLTNYQKDMEQYFTDGKDILIYTSMEEALDKCRFYLKNEKEAEKIRKNSFQLVKDRFSFEHQLNIIWETCGLKDKIKN